MSLLLAVLDVPGDLTQPCKQIMYVLLPWGLIKKVQNASRRGSSRSRQQTLGQRGTRGHASANLVLYVATPEVSKDFRTQPLPQPARHRKGEAAGNHR